MTDGSTSPLRGSGAVRGGWICFGIGIAVVAVSSLLGFLYIPLFVASFILGVVAIAMGRVTSGVALVLSTLILPMAVNALAPGFLGAIVGIHVAVAGG